MANMSEDALFKALLKNKPGQQPQKPAAAPATPRKEIPKPAPQPVERYEITQHLEELKVMPDTKPVNLEPVIDSINRLDSSVNMIYGMMKNIIMILILSLIILIAIFIK